MTTQEWAQTGTYRWVWCWMHGYILLSGKWAQTDTCRCVWCWRKKCAASIFATTTLEWAQTGTYRCVW